MTNYGYTNLGKLAKQYSGDIYNFLSLKDDDLGKTIYKNITREVEKVNVAPYKRTNTDELERNINPNFKSKKIKKTDYEQDWPFCAEEVILELRNRYWAIITIDGWDYALNGTASNKYKLELVDDAGMIIYGKPFYKFIDMAREL